MTNRILFTLICDDAREEKSNKLIIVGLYNGIIGFAQPPAQKGFARLGVQQTPKGGISAPRAKYGLPLLCIVRRWVLDSPVNVETAIIGPDGMKVASANSQLSPPQDGSHCQEIIKIGGLVLTPGPHKIVTTYNDGTPGTNEENFLVTEQV
jgi:hypothetical protein